MKPWLALTMLTLAACGLASRRSTQRPVPPTAPTESAAQQVTLCSIREGSLMQWNGRIDASTGDTLLDGQPLQRVYARGDSPFARGRPWFSANLSIEYADRRLFKNFPPRRFAPEDVMLVGEFNGTPLFMEAGANRYEPTIVYVLVDATCLMQAYFRT
jgi:hypothetical protein